MGYAQTTLLGGLAGATIYIGLPIGRSQRVGERTRVALAMLSVGILAFIFMDVAGHGQELVSQALTRFKDGRTGLGSVLGLFTVLAFGVMAGTAGMPMAAGAVARTRAARYRDAAQLAALRSGMTVAVAIGLHNLAEGLAIGAAARSGTIGLATVLVVGFALHNATEGFGIVGPLGAVRPSWRWLAMAGLVAGGPTLVGTLLGYEVRTEALQLTSYALAAGAILYVIGEIWTSTRRHGYRTLGLCALAAGFLAGVATDLLVSYGGV